MKRLASLRSRLLVLVLVAVLPAFALTLYTHLEHRRAAVAVAQEEALRIARIAASEQNDVFQDARRVAFTLAHLPEIRTLKAEACRPLLAELLSRSPEYVNISVAAPAGDVVCSGVPLSGLINLGDREYFQRALTTRDVAMSGYLLGRISKKAAIAIAYPAVDARGTVSAVVVIGLDLRSLNHLAADAQLPQGSTLLVIDQAGIILAHHPQGDEWVGKEVSDAPLAKAISAKHGEGTIAGVGLDGVPRLYGLTRLAATPDASAVYLAVGIPRSVALAESNRTLVRNLVLLGLVTVVALVGARVVAERLVLRRTEALAAATKRLAAGDLGARTGLPGDDSELGHLARSFDEMAEAVEQRTAERARAAAELVRSEKMAALGRLAAGVAHELRNPLSVIAGRIEILKLKMAPGQAPTFDLLTRSLAQFEEAAERMRRIMEGLSTYSKPAKPDPTPLDLGELLRATSEVLTYEARKHEVSIVLQVPPRLPRVVGDRSALMQVFVNLAMNAAQAMVDTGGGQLTLKACATDGSAASIVAEVTDTGPGIPPDALAQIWAPFYTTKAEGTGIGLSIVRSLVEQQPGATITVESRQGAGTTFRLTMPAIGADFPVQSSASYYSVPSVGDTWGMKERADEGRTRLDGGQVRVYATAERFIAPQRGLADALTLEVIPDELVGVQLGRVARQEMQFEATGEPLDVLGDHLGDMRGVAIEDQEHGTLAPPHEVREQLDEPRGVEPLGVDLVPEGAPGVDGGDGAHALTPPARRDRGRLAAHPPGAPEHLIGADPGLIEEKDLRPPALGPGAQARKHRCGPALDRRGIALVGAAQRFLRRDVQLGEQAPDGGHAAPHAEFLRDQRRHNLPGPQAKVEAVLPRVLAIDPAPHLEFLSRRQGGFPSRMFPRREGRCAPAPLGPQPFVNRGATQPIALDDIARDFAVLHPLDRHPADRLRGLVRECPAVEAHASSYHESPRCVD